MIKKFTLLLLAVIGTFSLTLSASTDITLKPYGEFYTYGSQKKELAETLGMNTYELDTYCKKNAVAFLAVNEDNTKQIKLFRYSDDFSNNIINISNLSDDNISSLLPDIIGVENAKGEIINRGGQKFIKAVYKSSDSGGEFITTQYITVADRKNYLLNFYTHTTESTDYIEKTFETYNSEFFIHKTQEKDSSHVQYIIMAAVIIFILAALAITATLVWDIIKKRKNSEAI